MISGIRNHEAWGPEAMVFSVHAHLCPLRDPTIQPQGVLKPIQSYFVTSSSRPPPPQLWENTLTHLCGIRKYPSLGCPPSGGSNGSTPRCQQSSEPPTVPTLCWSQCQRLFNRNKDNCLLPHCSLWWKTILPGGAEGGVGRCLHLHNATLSHCYNVTAFFWSKTLCPGFL